MKAKTLHEKINEVSSIDDENSNEIIDSYNKTKELHNEFEPTIALQKAVEKGHIQRFGRVMSNSLAKIENSVEEYGYYDVHISTKWSQHSVDTMAKNFEYLGIKISTEYDQHIPERIDRIRVYNEVKDIYVNDMIYYVIRYYDPSSANVDYHGYRPSNN